VLKALFPVPVQTDWTYAQGQFEVRRQPIAVDPAEPARQLGPDEEYPAPTQPQRAFVDVNDGQCGLAVLNRGLTEFEARPAGQNTTIALTLIRSVGWLSRPDLSTRFGNAGPSLPTPGAQCKGRQVCEYAIVPHAYDWEMAAVHQEAECYIAPLIAFAAPVQTGHWPARISFVRVEPAELVLSAFKLAESDDAIVLRFYNVSHRAINGELRFGFPVKAVRRANLAEVPIGEPLPISDDHSLRLEVGGNEIVTLLVGRSFRH